MEIVQPFHAAFFTADCPQGEKAFPYILLERPSPGHRIAEVGRHLWRSSNPMLLLKACSATAVCPGPCPVVVLTCPRMDIQIPQLLWETHCNIWRPWRSFFLCLNITSCIWICGYWILSCHWALLQRVWLCFLFSPHEVFIHIDKIPLTFFSPGWTVLGLDTVTLLSSSTSLTPPFHGYYGPGWHSLPHHQSPFLSQWTVNPAVCHLWLLSSRNLLDYSYSIMLLL